MSSTWKYPKSEHSTVSDNVHILNWNSLFKYYLSDSTFRKVFSRESKHCIPSISTTLLNPEPNVIQRPPKPHDRHRKFCPTFNSGTEKHRFSVPLLTSSNCTDVHLFFLNSRRHFRTPITGEGQAPFPDPSPLAFTHHPSFTSFHADWCHRIAVSSGMYKAVHYQHTIPTQVHAHRRMSNIQARSFKNVKHFKSP